MAADLQIWAKNLAAGAGKCSDIMAGYKFHIPPLFVLDCFRSGRKPGRRL